MLQGGKKTWTWTLLATGLLPNVFVSFDIFFFFIELLLDLFFVDLYIRRNNEVATTSIENE